MDSTQSSFQRNELPQAAADYGITPDEVRRRCPWADEYAALDGSPCWLRDDLDKLLNRDDDGRGAR